MRIDLLKPFDKGNYLSEEESLKLIESIPIPKDNAVSAKPAEAKTSIPEAENPLPEDNPVVDLEGRLIDLNPADNEKSKTQDEWIAYFNDRNEIMVSMPDLYLAGKSNNKDLLVSIKNDIRESRIITSTRIIYESIPYAKIIHYYGSNSIKPVEYNLFVPELCREELADVLATKEGLQYLQALFATKDDVQQIKNTLDKLRSYPFDENIYFWSTARHNRPSETVSCFGFFTRNMVVNFVEDYSHHYAHGRSRGMRIITPGTSQTTSGVK